MPLPQQDLRQVDTQALEYLEADRSLPDLEWRAVIAELARRAAGTNAPPFHSFSSSLIAEGGPPPRESFLTRNARKFQEDLVLARATAANRGEVPSVLQRHISSLDAQVARDRVELDRSIAEVGANFKAAKPALVAAGIMGLTGMLLMMAGAAILLVVGVLIFLAA
jgi:hypothetical protein